MSTKLFLATVLAALVPAAFAADNQWKIHGGTYDGDWADPNHWTLGHPPAGAGEIAYTFPAYGVSAVISYTNTVVTNASSALRLSARCNGSVSDGVTVLDGSGGSFLMPDLEGDATVYGNEPFGFRRGTDHFFNLQTYSASPAANTPPVGRHAVAEMTNAVIRIVDRKDNAGTKVDFLQGYLNLFNPCGSTWANMPYVMFPGASMGNFSYLEVEFHAGSEVHLPYLYCQGSALTNVLSFTGGRHTIHGMTYAPNNSQAYNHSKKNVFSEIRVTDGAVLEMNGLAVGCTPSSTYGVPSNMHTRVSVSDGAFLDMKNYAYLSSYADLDFAVRDGGSVRLTSSGGQTYTFGNATPSKFRLEVSDATFTVSASTKLALGSNTTNRPADGVSVCVMTNAIVENAGEFYVYSGLLDVTGGTWSNKTFNVGCSTYGYPAAATFRDVSFDSWGAVGVESGATLTLDGGLHHFFGSLRAGCLNDITSAGAGRIVITNDASVYVQTPSGGSISYMQIGANVGSCGAVEQYSGQFNVEPYEGVVIGNGGIGRYEMHGGTLRTPQIRLGYLASGTPEGQEDVLYQTGGLIDVTADNNLVGVNVPDANGNHGRVILNGGTLRCHAVHGWTGARAKGGTGWAAFEADGGTIEMPHVFTDKQAIENFDEAYVGAKGLTIASAFPMNFAQDFTDKAGAEGAGLLRLTGAGTKYVMSTNSAPSLLRVEEGLAVFKPLEVGSGADKVAVPAKMASAVTVVNEGGLSLMGGQTGITFKSLSMADRSKIQVDVGDVFRVQGVPELGVLRVKVSDGILPVGTYDVIVAEGTVSDETKDAWARSMLVNGLDEGNIVTFTTEEAGGETLFRLTVGAGTPLTDETALRGADWDDAANWGATGKPTGMRRAVVDDESPATATLAADSDVGAIRFNRAGGVTLTGSGSLHVANTGYAVIESLKDDSAIDVALGWTGDLLFPIAPGSSVTLGGTIDGKRLVKTLGGALYLTGTNNRLDSGFSAEGGKLSFAGTGSMGVSTSGADGVFKAGTLEFTGSAELTTTLRVATPEGTGAVAFKTDADVVLHDPVFEQGALVKRGSAPLTLDFSRAATIGVGGGNSALNANPTQTPFTFANDDPTSGGVIYTGCDVCEGDLVIRAPQGTAINMPCAARIGAATSAYDAERRAPPRLVLDGAKVNMIASSRHTNLGGGLTDSNTFADEAALVLTNGAYLLVDSLKLGNASSRRTLKNRVIVDASTLYVKYELYSALQSCDDEHVPEYLFTRGAELRAPVNVLYPVKFTFDASDFYGSAETGVNFGQLRVSWNTTSNSRTYGDFGFRRGGRFYCKDVQTAAQATRATRFHFDDGEWIPTLSGNFDFAFSNVEVCVEQGGLKLNPPINSTWSLPLSVTGAVGRVVKGGIGTLALTGTDGAFAPGGVSAVETGTLKIGAGAVAEGVKFAVAAGALVDLDGTTQTQLGISGAGTVANGTLVSPTFGAAVADDGTAEALPQISADVVLSGAATVDLGRTRDMPLATFGPLPVLRYAGAAPDVSAWRLRNSGIRNARGTFTATDGVVNVSIEVTGMALIFR